MARRAVLFGVSPDRSDRDQAEESSQDGQGNRRDTEAQTESPGAIWGKVGLFDVRGRDASADQPDRFAHSFFMNSRPSRASCSSLSNIGRQIFVAAARLGTRPPKASIVSQPS